MPIPAMPQILTPVQASPCLIQKITMNMERRGTFGATCHLHWPYKRPTSRHWSRDVPFYKNSRSLIAGSTSVQLPEPVLLMLSLSCSACDFSCATSQTLDPESQCCCPSCLIFGRSSCIPLNIAAGNFLSLWPLILLWTRIYSGQQHLDHPRLENIEFIGQLAWLIEVLCRQ